MPDEDRRAACFVTQRQEEASSGFKNSGSTNSGSCGLKDATLQVFGLPIMGKHDWLQEIISNRAAHLNGIETSMNFTRRLLLIPTDATGRWLFLAAGGFLQGASAASIGSFQA